VKGGIVIVKYLSVLVVVCFIGSILLVGCKTRTDSPGQQDITDGKFPKAEMTKDPSRMQKAMGKGPGAPATR